MAENHDLGVLGRPAAAQQEQPAKDAGHDEIQKSDRHSPRSCLTTGQRAKPQVTASVSSSGAVQVPRGNPPAHHAGKRHNPRQCLSRPTPKEMTSTDSVSAETDSTAMSSFARTDKGMVSVGLNAEELVTETYR
jgi:hypothetical protein